MTKRQNREHDSSSPIKTKPKNVGRRFLFPVAIFESFLERDGTYLYKYGRSDRRPSSSREGKTFYVEQATRGLRFCEFFTNSER